MPDPIRVERDGRLAIKAWPSGHIEVENPDSAGDVVGLSAADLLWLVTTGGPAMIALLGGPHAIKTGGDDEPE